MKIRKAVITAAGRNQRTLPLQTLIDRDGAEKSVLRIILEEVLTAKIEEICVVVSPGDEAAYSQAAGDLAAMIRFVPQPEAIGYGHALYCAKDFVRQDPFLHLVGDHLYVSAGPESCAQQLVRVAAGQACAVSAVQPTRAPIALRFDVVPVSFTSSQWRPACVSVWNRSGGAFTLLITMSTSPSLSTSPKAAPRAARGVVTGAPSCSVTSSKRPLPRFM